MNKEAVLRSLQDSKKDTTEFFYTDIFYTDIPKGGYMVNAPLNFYFEYYPHSVNGDYELWVPVVKSDVCEPA